MQNLLDLPVRTSLEKWLDAGRWMPHTERNYRSAARLCLPLLPEWMRALTPRRLMEFHDAACRRWDAPRTINTQFIAMRSWLNWARRRGHTNLTAADISDALRHVRVTRAFPEIVPAAVLPQLAHEARGSRHALWIFWLLLTGTRMGEAIRLRWEDLELGRQTAFIPQTKTGVPRILDLSLAPTLVEMLRWHWQPSGRVWPVSEWTPASWLRRWNGVRWSPQMLRRTCASWLVNGPWWPIYRVAQQLGHDVETAQRHYWRLVDVPRDAPSLCAAMGVA